MKVQVGGTRSVIAVRRVFKTRVTRISVYATAVRCDGFVLIASMPMIRYVQSTRKILDVDVVQESDLNGVSQARAECWSWTRDALGRGPNLTGVRLVVALEKTHLSGVCYTP